MKSTVQIRAERAAKRFHRSARRPIVVEFAGVPKAGKTSTLMQLRGFLHRCGFRVEVVVERASVCPIRDKKHANFNVWTACTTLAQLLEKTQDPPRADDPDVLILDRGIFDALCWLEMMKCLGRIRANERKAIENFLRMGDWRRRITAVVVMFVSPELALKREQEHLPVETKSGSIMNLEVLQKMRQVTDRCVSRFGKEFKILMVDTSKNDPRATAESVADDVLNVIESELDENILCVERRSLQQVFARKRCLDGSRARSLVRLFEEKGEFKPRNDVEKSPSLVQALPVVIVRNRSGEVLRLTRREKFSTDPLHKKTVIWAGGHVRREDGIDGHALINGAVRELEEELRLRIEPADLRLLGGVYHDGGEKTSRHVAVVYEWRATSGDVSIALNHAEFIERGGTSMRGDFVRLSDIRRSIRTREMNEAWSVAIVRVLLASTPQAE